MLPLALLVPLAIEPPEADAQLERAQAIFDESCTLCHDATDDLNLEDAGALVGQTASTGVPLIAPGDPNGSYLYQKMIGAEGIEGDIMPLGEDPLPVEQLTIVRDWIAGIPAARGDEAGETSGEASGETGEAGGETAPVAPVVDDPPVVPKAKPRQPFFGTHQINLQTTTTLGKKTIAFRIHHRLGLVGQPGDRQYLGLAGGAVMSIGAEYGIVDGLDAMVRWTNSRLDWELGLKYVPVRQEDGMPLSFGMFGSFEAISEARANAANRFTGNFQVMLSRLWFERWATQLTVNYSMLTNHAPRVFLEQDDGTLQRVTDDRGTLNVALATTVWVDRKRRHGIDLEYSLPIPSDAFFHRGGNVNPEGTRIGSWALGWSARVGLHVFQVFVTNTRNIHTNLAAPGGDTENPFSPFGDFFFGFNITRKWKL